MNRSLTALIVICCIPLAAVADLTDGLVAYYPLNGDAADASGNGNNGVVSGAQPTVDRLGNPLGAYFFDGVDDRINIGNGVKPLLPLSVSLWANLDELNGPTGHDMFINDMEDGNWRYYGVYARCNDGKLTARFNSGGVAAPSTRRNKRTDEIVFEVGQWHHVAAVFVNANDIRLYVDGVERVGTYGGSATTLGYSSHDGYLGSREEPNGTFEGIFAGKLDEVRIYDRVLSAEEIEILAGPGVFNAGVVSGFVLADCPTAGSPLAGVDIDLYDNSTGDLVATSNTGENGYYEFQNLLAGVYHATALVPLGYYTDTAEVLAVLDWDTPGAVADYSLYCIETPMEPRGIGFWKRQVAVANGANGNAQIDGTTICSYLDLVESHFNSNAINQVVVYVRPSSGLCQDKLIVAKDLLNLRGHQEPIARARQQLMTLLLNTAAQYTSLAAIVSEDGGTLSQAVTYCDYLIDDPAGDHELAMDIAAMINGGETVGAGVIPLDIEQIAYRQADGAAPNAFALEQNAPNPFNPATRIAFTVPSEEIVRLAVYNLAGARIATLVNEYKQAGRHEVIWAGTDDTGQRVPSGAYFCRMEAGSFAETTRMVLVK